jgi:hypothetical protein
MFAVNGNGLWLLIAEARVRLLGGIVDETALKECVFSESCNFFTGAPHSSLFPLIENDASVVYA